MGPLRLSPDIMTKTLAEAGNDQKRIVCCGLEIEICECDGMVSDR